MWYLHRSGRINDPASLKEGMVAPKPHSTELHSSKYLGAVILSKDPATFPAQKHHPSAELQVGKKFAWRP